jgi:hypothetical protein
MVPLLLPDDAPMRDREVEEAVVKDARAAKPAAAEAAQKATDAVSQATVEQVCLAYLADAEVNARAVSFGSQTIAAFHLRRTPNAQCRIARRIRPRRKSFVTQRLSRVKERADDERGSR